MNTTESLLKQIALGEGSVLELKDVEYAGNTVISRRIFSDRLKLYSPGSIPNIMTVEILSLLARCPMNYDATGSKRSFIMDKRGEGVPIIISESLELPGKKPDYALIDDAELRLTIFAA